MFRIFVDKDTILNTAFQGTPGWCKCGHEKDSHELWVLKSAFDILRLQQRDGSMMDYIDAKTGCIFPLIDFSVIVFDVFLYTAMYLLKP